MGVGGEGRGIPRGEEAKIFEAFYTTKDPGKGTGLGLAVAKRTIQALGGTLAVRPNEPRGCVLRLTLPAKSTS